MLQLDYDKRRMPADELVDMEQQTAVVDVVSEFLHDPTRGMFQALLGAHLVQHRRRQFGCPLVSGVQLCLKLCVKEPAFSRAIDAQAIDTTKGVDKDVPLRDVEALFCSSCRFTPSFFRFGKNLRSFSKTI